MAWHKLEQVVALIHLTECVAPSLIQHSKIAVTNESKRKVKLHTPPLLFKLPEIQDLFATAAVPVSSCCSGTVQLTRLSLCRRPRQLGYKRPPQLQQQHHH